MKPAAIPKNCGLPYPGDSRIAIAQRIRVSAQKNPHRGSVIMSTSLNSANYTTVWNADFKSTSSLDSSLFPISWGGASEFSFGSNGVTLKSNGSSAGFMNKDEGAADGYGYGLYQATVTMPTNQANGAFIDLWPSTNAWPGPEIDLIEQNGGQPYSTVHWAGSNGSNQYHAANFSADLSQPTTVAVDWEANGLTFYVNGVQVAQYLAGGSVPIPKDYAHGGENSSFGVGNTGPAGTSLTVSDLSYSVPTGSASSAVAATTTTTASASKNTAADPAQATTTPISFSNPGIQFVASPAAGATVPMTISAPGLKEVYAQVLNSQNVAEGGWIDIPLNAKGQATYDFHLQHSGDSVLAAANTTTETDKSISAHVSILTS